jgi:hypothetical protein
MSLWAGVKGTKGKGGMWLETIDQHGEAESMRQIAERKLSEFQALMPSARVWIHKPRGTGFEIHTSSQRLRDIVNSGGVQRWAS